jgi:hypothetical protein
MARVDQTRGRPTRGSSASIVLAKRPSMSCRTISCMAGASRRRSPVVHAMVVVPWDRRSTAWAADALAKSRNASQASLQAGSKE